MSKIMSFEKYQQPLSAHSTPMQQPLCLYPLISFLKSLCQLEHVQAVTKWNEKSCGCGMTGNIILCGI